MASVCGALLNRPPNKLGGRIGIALFFARHPPTLSQGEQKTLRYARFPPRNTGFLRSPAKKAHWAFFPWLPLRRLVGAPPRASRARSRGGLAFPPLSPVARVCVVRSSALKGFASANAPLRFVPSLCPSAPSASVSRGRLRASAWLKTPSRVPSALHPRSLAPSGSPLRSPCPRYRSPRGALARSGRCPSSLGVGVSRPPRFWGCALRCCTAYGMGDIKNLVNFVSAGFLHFRKVCFLPPPARLSRRERQEAWA